MFQVRVAEYLIKANAVSSLSSLHLIHLGGFRCVASGRAGRAGPCVVTDLYFYGCSLLSRVPSEAVVETMDLNNSICAYSAGKI